MLKKLCFMVIIPFVSLERKKNGTKKQNFIQPAACRLTPAVFPERSGQFQLSREIKKTNPRHAARRRLRFLPSIRTSAKTYM